MRTLAALILAAVLTLAARAQQKEPWLKAGDVVALVGGEDMVALAEEGWLETLVTWAQPGDRIRFRSLAWEGDTVFEQRRDLNYPTLETQLDKMGATVVLCQFGKMESFAGKEGVAAFTEAYGKLLARLSGEKKRRIALVLPTRFGPLATAFLGEFLGHDGEGLLPFLKRIGGPPKEPARALPDLRPRNRDLALYNEAIRTLATKHGAALLEPEPGGDDGFDSYPTRDGIHLAPVEHYWVGIQLVTGLGPDVGIMIGTTAPALHEAIVAKNRLWHHYARPQNWAFLAGNRTNQPSSRDHRDPTRRWFPEEMEQWIPLIEAKEKEIWALAAAPR